MMRRSVLALLLLGLAASHAPAQDATAPRDLILRGYGAAMACGEWLDLRRAAGGMFASQKRELYRATVGWSLGYLSGAARWGENLDPLRDMDEEATVAWLAAHCARSPGTQLRSALEAFIEAHPAR